MKLWNTVLQKKDRGEERRKVTVWSVLVISELFEVIFSCLTGWWLEVMNIKHLVILSKSCHLTGQYFHSYISQYIRHYIEKQFCWNSVQIKLSQNKQLQLRSSKVCNRATALKIHWDKTQDDLTMSQSLKWRWGKRTQMQINICKLDLFKETLT